MFYLHHCGAVWWDADLRRLCHTAVSWHDDCYDIPLSCHPARTPCHTSKYHSAFLSRILATVQDNVFAQPKNDSIKFQDISFTTNVYWLGIGLSFSWPLLKLFIPCGHVFGCFHDFCLEILVEQQGIGQRWRIEYYGKLKKQCLDKHGWILRLVQSGVTFEFSLTWTI